MNEIEKNAIAYVPENSEDGHVYRWPDFLKITKGNVALAEELVLLCTWQHPETEIDQLLRDEIIEEKGVGFVFKTD